MVAFASSKKSSDFFQCKALSFHRRRFQKLFYYSQRNELQMQELNRHLSTSFYSLSGSKMKEFFSRSLCESPDCHAVNCTNWVWNLFEHINSSEFNKESRVSISFVLMMVIWFISGVFLLLLMCVCSDAPVIFYLLDTCFSVWNGKSTLILRPYRRIHIVSEHSTW